MRFLGPGDGELDVFEGVTSAVLAACLFKWRNSLDGAQSFESNDHVSGLLL